MVKHLVEVTDGPWTVFTDAIMRPCFVERRSRIPSEFPNSSTADRGVRSVPAQRPLLRPDGCGRRSLPSLVSSDCALRTSRSWLMLDELDAGRYQHRRVRNVSAYGAVSFHFERATPILIRWLPQIEDTRARDAIARSLTVSGKPENSAPLGLYRRVLQPAQQSRHEVGVRQRAHNTAEPSDADKLIAPSRPRARKRAPDALSSVGSHP